MIIKIISFSILHLAVASLLSSATRRMRTQKSVKLLISIPGVLALTTSQEERVKRHTLYTLPHGSNATRFVFGSPTTQKCCECLSELRSPLCMTTETQLSHRQTNHARERTKWKSLPFFVRVHNNTTHILEKLCTLSGRVCGAHTLGGWPLNCYSINIRNISNHTVC